MIKVNYDRKCYTITDFYLSYLDYIERGTVYEVDYKMFRKILQDYFRYIANEVIMNGKEFKFPCRMGTLQVIKHKPKNFNSKSLRIDFGTSKALGKKIYNISRIAFILFAVNDTVGSPIVVTIVPPLKGPIKSTNVIGGVDCNISANSLYLFINIL